MGEEPVNIFEDQFVLESFDGEHAVEPQCSSINPQVIANHGGLSQGKDFGNAGPGRQSTRRAFTENHTAATTVVHYQKHVKLRK